jgi:hypothetical protein
VEVALEVSGGRRDFRRDPLAEFSLGDRQFIGHPQATFTQGIPLIL